jgi:ATP-dependent RNA helicase UAP56/SUB2
LDVLCQAKAGMGKTVVFVIATLQQLASLPEDQSVSLNNKPLAICICHTHELADQIHAEFKRFTKYLPDIRTAAFYGGQPRKENVALLESDAAPHIVVGTPGRLLDLAEPFTGRNGRGDGSVALDLSNIKIFIVDECDRVLATEAAGRGMREKVQKIFMKTPKEKQVMMFSATLDQETSKTCELFMQDPLLITLVGREKELVLHGLKQYVAKIPESEKNAKLVDILDDVQFNQAIIFVDSSERAEKLNQMLVEATFPSAALHGHVKSSDGKSNGRAEKFSEFKSYKSRILVTTDLCARGVDVERVNVVINYDFPGDADTYMHRVGRAGRFGTKGMAISFVRSDADEHKANRAEKTEAEVYEEVQNRFKAKLSDLPDSIDPSDYK